MPRRLIDASDSSASSVPSPKRRRSEPTDQEVRHLGRWWKQYKDQPLDEIVDEATLAKALADVGVLALGYLARRLTNPQTPLVVRDRIALALGPKMQVLLHKGMPPDESDDEGDDVLDAYGSTPPRLDS